MVLVDGSYFLWRAYDELLQRNRDPEPDAAITGFVRSLMSLLRSRTDTYVGIAFDAADGCSWRRKLFPDYKARHNRAGDDMERLHHEVIELCDSLGISPLMRRDYEACDVISTCGLDAIKLHPEMHVTAACGHSLILPLVGEGVDVLDSLRSTKAVSKDSLTRQYGVQPTQIADFFALVGGRSDNLPGVPGIGPKTASRLLNEHIDLEHLLTTAITNPAALPLTPKKLQALLEHADAARLALKLRALKRIPEAPKLAALVCPELDIEAGARWCNKMALPAAAQALKNPKAFAPARFTKSPKKIANATTKGDNASASFDTPIAPVVPSLPSRGSTDGVTEVRDVATAEQVSGILRSLAGKKFAVDCEFDALGPDARVICFSVYAGEDIDFGNGPRLWVDTATSETGAAVLNAFQEFFESESHPKVYHNFSEDRRALHNCGIKHRGFGGDTMQMARLWDASLSFYDQQGYSLSFLTSFCLGDAFKKHSMTELFGKGAAASPLIMQQSDNAQLRQKWVDYSTFDSVATYHLWHNLRSRLLAQPWIPLNAWQEQPGESMWDFYSQYWLKFGELLSDMEMYGMGIDLSRLREMEEQATRDRLDCEAKVRGWAVSAAEQLHGVEYVARANLHALNVGSDAQVRQLLFGGIQNKEWTCGCLPEEHTLLGVQLPSHEICEEGSESAVNPSQEKTNAQFDELNELKVAELKELLREKGLKISGKKAELVSRLTGLPVQAEAVPKKTRTPKVTIRCLTPKLRPEQYTKKGWPSVSASVLEKILKTQADTLGPDASLAVKHLVDISELDGQINSFIRPLQEYGCTGRIRASFNLNTETGRLSSRRPNLQNQPFAGRFRVREAFTADVGCSLLIADYTQLELRILAHLSSCKEMCDILNSGGDLHSRTAARVFESVKKAHAAGHIRIDSRTSGEGEGPIQSSESLPPLLKDEFPEERKRAKTLNFAVIYGMSASTLARDWGVSRLQAESYIASWYDCYPEVRQWQERTIQEAHKLGSVRTIMGRKRHLRELLERVAINSPVQGSAADIVTLAMLRIQESNLLKELGFRLSNQIHDEVILEGPKEGAAEALDEVIRLMEDPLPFQLDVKLSVDARCANRWQGS